jgi:hypothetical protein
VNKKRKLEKTASTLQAKQAEKEQDKLSSSNALRNKSKAILVKDLPHIVSKINRNIDKRTEIMSVRFVTLK